jgi:glycine betaine catabolism B
VLTLPIREIVDATPRARIVRLALDDEPFEYTAGQAVKVGAHGGEKRRPYSIAAAPEDMRETKTIELLVGVDADGRAGSHLSLEIDAPVDVEGPLGTFTFPDRPDERNFVFIAGGTGIAPLRAMMRHAIRGPIDPRFIGLLYSARTPSEFAYQEELRALASTGALELRQTITRESDGDWSGARGRIDRLALTELVHDADTLCFVCGPAPMVDEMPKLLAEIGIPRERIKIEEW